MRAIGRLVILALILLAASSGRIHAAVDPIPIGALVKDGKKYDGKEVAIEGEAIGDVMRRGRIAWVNVLSSDGTAIGVVMQPDQLRNVGVMGDYSHRGDRLLVRGTMYRFAPMFQGETCIIAAEVTVLQKGHSIVHRPSAGKVALAIFLTVCCVACAILYKMRYPTGEIGKFKIGRYYE